MRLFSAICCGGLPFCFVPKGFQQLDAGFYYRVYVVDKSCCYAVDDGRYSVDDAFEYRYRSMVVGWCSFYHGQHPGVNQYRTDLGTGSLI